MTDQLGNCEGSEMNISIKEEPMDPIKEEFKDTTREDCKDPIKEVQKDASKEECKTPTEEEFINPIKEEFKTPTKRELKHPDYDFDLECSDEEFQTKDGKKWEPSPEDVIEMYEKLDKDQILEIGWTTPAKRPLTPVATFECKKKEDTSKEMKSETKSDFDFQDEVSPTNMKSKAIRPAGYDMGPRGSAKKKTVSLDAILSNMARHRKLDMMEDEDEDPLP